MGVVVMIKVLLVVGLPMMMLLPQFMVTVVFACEDFEKPGTRTTVDSAHRFLTKVVPSVRFVYCGFSLNSGIGVFPSI